MSIESNAPCIIKFPLNAAKFPRKNPNFGSDCWVFVRNGSAAIFFFFLPAVEVRYRASMNAHVFDELAREFRAGARFSHACRIEMIPPQWNEVQRAGYLKRKPDCVWMQANCPVEQVGR
ncbi:hypothetical protein QS306_14965 [Paraburkholderia bonniea]|uniref:hypothetical protein n=1 Tax=Paraburkholderia bonniea TaxID=2152891 RepID=UPI00257267BB|nr:hypothetical protein [Paraburkholderia bonniea]WJF92059.1 hypothetical protein QS306_14965 [Paraburkholderia bonniea]WJF95379.1 hypothetical protein QS308_14970 [Paraburkholderia bonniea]